MMPPASMKALPDEEFSGRIVGSFVQSARAAGGKAGRVRWRSKRFFSWTELLAPSSEKVYNGCNMDDGWCLCVL